MDSLEFTSKLKMGGSSARCLFDEVCFTPRGHCCGLTEVHHREVRSVAETIYMQVGEQEKVNFEEFVGF